MIPIYVIHYPPLEERRKYLESMIDAIWVTNFRRENLSKAHIESCYRPDKDIWNKRVEGLYEEAPPFYELPLGMISCSSGHLYALETIANSNSPGIILEDDACILVHSLNKEIENILNSPPPQWDIIFLGGAFYHESVSKTISSIQGPNNFRYLLKSHPASNTVCAYMVTPLTAQRLYESIKKFTLPIDFEFNYWMKQYNMLSYHIIPYIIREGTSAGIYKTSQVRS